MTVTPTNFYWFILAYIILNYIAVWLVNKFDAFMDKHGYAWIEQKLKDLNDD